MFAKSILIKNGRVVDPSSGVDTQQDILIEEQKISTIAVNIEHRQVGAGQEVIDASNKIVLPGLVDIHTHLRDPGRADEETIYSGTRAAALGGFTSIACMANTDPFADSAAVIKYIVSKSKAEGAVNVFPIGAVSKRLAGSELAEIGMMIKEGAVAFSDDGNSVANAELYRHAIEYVSQFGKTVISHPEDKSLSNGGVMNESYLSTILGLPGIPRQAEITAVYRDIQFAAQFGRIHIAHVSCAESVAIIRKAKEDGIPVTCETAPHYFTLTEDEVEGYNTNAKMNPPLRSEHDVSAIVAGLKDGTIDCIASDHAPHSIDEKNVEFNNAAFGIVGIETAFPLVYTELVETKILTMTKAVEKLTVNPAKVIGINKGTLGLGSDADVTIVDPRKYYTIDVSKFVSKSKNSPFDGWKIKGAIDTVIVGGNIVVKNGKLCV